MPPPPTLHDNERYGEVRGRSVHGWKTVGCGWDSGLQRVDVVLSRAVYSGCDPVTITDVLSRVGSNVTSR